MLSFAGEGGGLRHVKLLHFLLVENVQVELRVVNEELLQVLLGVRCLEALVEDLLLEVHVDLEEAFDGLHERLDALGDVAILLLGFHYKNSEI